MSRRAPSDNREVDPRVESWMRRAIATAVASRPHPNPRVGAIVLTPQGDQLGAAAHLGPGTPHAEVLALAQAGADAVGGTVVTTLEPCSHHGRTPPCTDALIAAGVARVIVGAVDPDKRVSGAGISQLRDAGVDVVTGVLEREVISSDPGYYHHRTTGRPRFTVKLAATLDGQTAAADGTSQWITSEEARLDSHAARAKADAVVIGAGTLRADDPSLDVRLPGYEGAQPQPIVVSGAEALPKLRRLYHRNPLIYSPHPLSAPPGCEVVVAGGSSGVDLSLVAKDLGRRGILEVIVDGGPTLASSFMAAGLVDHILLYFGARVGGGAGIPMFTSVFATLEDAIPVDIETIVKVGPDVRVDAKPRKAGP